MKLLKKAAPQLAPFRVLSGLAAKETPWPSPQLRHRPGPVPATRNSAPSLSPREAPHLLGAEGPETHGPRVGTGPLEIAEGEPWGPSGLGWRLSLPRRGHRNLPPPPPLCGAHWPSHSGLLQTVVIVGVFSSTSKEASPPGGTWAGAGDEPWGDWRGGEQEGSGIASGGSGPSPNPRLG